MSRDVLPVLGHAIFQCPHCQAVAQHNWFNMFAIAAAGGPNLANAATLRNRLAEEFPGTPAASKPTVMRAARELLAAIEEGRPGFQSKTVGPSLGFELSNAHLSRCVACSREAIWIGSEILFPHMTAGVPPANADLPADVAKDYLEASLVVSASPRSAAALLRLALEKTCAHILGEHLTINEMIGRLVAKGMHVHIQQALDVLRVVGNEAVHPGTIDLTDDRTTALQLFELLNLVAEAMISQPRHIQAMYASLPAEKLKGIEGRDAKAKGTSAGEK